MCVKIDELLKTLVMKILDVAWCWEGKPALLALRKDRAGLLDRY
jgi:hypothetical protein